MVIYKNSSAPSLSSSSILVTGAPAVSGILLPTSPEFLAWQPSTWPNCPTSWDSSLIGTLRRIFEESMVKEIDNVIADAGGDLRHRGHVIAIALLCALDAISSYGYGRHNGRQIPIFVRAHFPADYHQHADALLKLYRHAMVHGWNLFGAAILPGQDPVTQKDGVVCFGLLNFRGALSAGLESYLRQLAIDTSLQATTLGRYREQRDSAKS
jgi:hypothetical protein